MDDVAAERDSAQLRLLRAQFAGDAEGYRGEVFGDHGDARVCEGPSDDVTKGCIGAMRGVLRTSSLSTSSDVCGR